ncbi:MAG: Muramoyltetrapeptide carboxypeptidase, partial [uncultured Thermomicrobiales bacterium]
GVATEAASPARGDDDRDRRAEQPGGGIGRCGARDRGSRTARLPHGDGGPRARQPGVFSRNGRRPRRGSADDDRARRCRCDHLPARWLRRWSPAQRPQHAGAAGATAGTRRSPAEGDRRLLRHHHDPRADRARVGLDHVLRPGRHVVQGRDRLHHRRLPPRADGDGAIRHPARPRRSVCRDDRAGGRRGAAGWRLPRAADLPPRHPLGAGPRGQALLLRGCQRGALRDRPDADASAGRREDATLRGDRHRRARRVQAAHPDEHAAPGRHLRRPDPPARHPDDLSPADRPRQAHRDPAARGPRPPRRDRADVADPRTGRQL